MSPAIVLRNARAGDHGPLLRLARILDSTSLPTDARGIRALLRRSARSFRGAIEHRDDGVYVFVAEERDTGKVVGSSLVFAKHGTPESPHYYLDVQTEERYSKTLRRMFRHTFLRLRHSMDGPSEIGGLIVDPAARRGSARVGAQLSFVRFLYMALHPERFESSVIAEMKPPLDAKGESRFWESYGARVTGLRFREADRLSTRDKEFIPALFPEAPLYTCMLPVEVQEELGRVGSDSVGAVRLLERIGLRFLDQIDPFDAGPYYGAPLRDVTLVRDFRAVEIAPAREGDPKPEHEFLVGVERRGFLAFRTPGRLVEDVLSIPAPTLAALRLGRRVRGGAVPFS